ncbi:MAG TPA: hypothetical protein VFE19_13460 [Jatrophihabitantaceae bacterium]|nr:hypothetical protein [Jatrophihabitantaceae bacterium]
MTDAPVIGSAVLDVLGTKIGRLVDVYRDTTDEHCDFAAVRVGHLLHRRCVFVPLTDATVKPHSVQVKCGRKLALKAPKMRTGESVGAGAELATFTHYGIRYKASVDATRLRRQRGQKS